MLPFSGTQITRPVDFMAKQNNQVDIDRALFEYTPIITTGNKIISKCRVELGNLRLNVPKPGHKNDVFISRLRNRRRRNLKVCVRNVRARSFSRIHPAYVHKKILSRDIYRFTVR